MRCPHCNAESPPFVPTVHDDDTESHRGTVPRYRYKGSKHEATATEDVEVVRIDNARIGAIGLAIGTRQ